MSQEEFQSCFLGHKRRKTSVYFCLSPKEGDIGMVEWDSVVEREQGMSRESERGLVCFFVEFNRRWRARFWSCGMI